MNIIILIFMIIATVFAVASLGYVAVDVTLEVIAIKKEEKSSPSVIVSPSVQKPEPEPEPKPEPQPEPIPEIVEQINAEEADAMISDTQAMETANYERGAGHGKQGIINIGVIDEHFAPYDVITLTDLKQKGLIPKNVGRLKVLADGILSKPLTVKSESYSVQAIKMIELTGGTVIILKD